MTALMAVLKDEIVPYVPTLPKTHACAAACLRRQNGTAGRTRWRDADNWEAGPLQ